MKLCTICACEGSTKTPSNIIRPLLGKPMLAYTIEQARALAQFDCIVVSSDSDAILATVKEYGANYAIKYPAENNAGKLNAIAHAVTQAELLFGKHFDLVVNLKATTPLRAAEDILGAIELQRSNGAKSVVTGALSHRSPYFNLVETNGKGQVRLSKPSTILRRQDSPKCYDMNESVSVWPRAVVGDDLKMLYDNTRLYEMSPERSVNGDNEMDFLIIELIMQKRAP